MLEAAKNLEHLILWYDNSSSATLNTYQVEENEMERSLFPHVELGNMVGSLSWEKLHTLSITSFTTSRPELFSVLRRHAASLKHLQLSNLWLVKDDIPLDDDKNFEDEILQVVENELRLESLELDGYWGVESEGGPTEMYDLEDVCSKWEPGGQLSEGRSYDFSVAKVRKPSRLDLVTTHHHEKIRIH